PTTYMYNLSLHDALPIFTIVLNIQKKLMHSGANMIDLYYWTTPNGHKITMFLEEVGLNYKIIPINIGTGDQFKPEFLEIAPNNRDRKSTRLNSSHVSISY